MSVSRILVFAAGLCGAAGVGLSAAAAHMDGGNLRTAANFLLFHAPALLAVGLFGAALPGRKVLNAGALILMLGVALFSGDLAMRAYLGHRLFPMAAPAGGLLTIAGWLAVAASAFAARRET
jgi:uncharacterized membrane protein YgdD (TMEM256/DUF423 family)